MTVSPTLMQAILAMDSYNQGYNSGLIHGVTQIGTATVSDKLSDFNLETEAQAAGFYAVAYNYDGDTVISYRGTDQNIAFPWSSVGSDFWNGYGVSIGTPLGEQARLAAEFYNAVDASSSAPITLTGHSMGGGLAGFVGSIYDADAKLSQNLEALIKLRPDEWRSSDINWVVDIVGDQKIMQGLFARLRDGVFKGQTFNL